MALTAVIGTMIIVTMSAQNQTSVATNPSLDRAERINSTTALVRDLTENWRRSNTWYIVWVAISAASIGFSVVAQFRANTKAELLRSQEATLRNLIDADARERIEASKNDAALKIEAAKGEALKEAKRIETTA